MAAHNTASVMLLLLPDISLWWTCEKHKYCFDGCFAYGSNTCALILLSYFGQKFACIKDQVMLLHNSVKDIFCFRCEESLNLKSFLSFQHCMISLIIGCITGISIHEYLNSLFAFVWLWLLFVLKYALHHWFPIFWFTELSWENVKSTKKLVLYW